MNIKKHLPWLGALLPVASMQAETKPNVVVIYIDDMESEISVVMEVSLFLLRILIR